MLGKTQEGLQDLLGAKRLAEIQHNDSALCSVYNGLGLYEQNVTCDYYRSLNYYREGVISPNVADTGCCIVC